MGAPEIWLAAVAQHTETIRIGHGVVLLPPPFNHPIRVAERIGALDILSSGRVDFGTGRSFAELELDGFGIDPGDSRRCGPNHSNICSSYGATAMSRPASTGST